MPDTNTRVFMHDARFVVGWQKQSERIKDLIWDYYLGVGIRTIKDEYYDVDLRKLNTGYAEHPIVIISVKMALPF